MATTQTLVEKLKEVNIKDKYAVTGYIREQSFKDIPYGIMQICILFFAFIERWSSDYKAAEIQITDRIATITAKYTGALRSVLGDTIVISKGIHHWRLKLLQVNGTTNWKVAIGIVQVKNITAKQLKNYVKSYLTHYIYGSTENIRAHVFVACRNQGLDPKVIGYKTKYHDTYCKNNDIIDMYLDLNTKRLSFAVNDEYLGIAKSDIPPLEYRMGVSISGWGTSVELISYSELNEMPAF